MTSIEYEQHLTSLDATRAPISTGVGIGEGLRRALNVCVALLGLLIAAPAMALVAVFIKLTSHGPVIYTQTRVGVNRRSGSERRRQTRDRLSCRRWRNQGGRPFRIYKFRTMSVSDGNADAQVWASPDDPRVTRIGALLRQYRLDELPQLVNVLIGDMNMVGPRPEQPEIFESLSNSIERYADRQRVLPGITGWAQVNHHYDTCEDSVRRKTALDLQYLDRLSAFEDVRIMARTVPVMVFRKGAW